MAASIADVFFKAILDDTGLEVDAKKSGDRAGKALAGGLQDAIKKGLFATFSAGAAIATKGLLELQQVQADFQAETGATADEAERAGKAINQMAGRNLQPMKEIGRALTKVHTDLGLTGDEAEKTTELFLKFGRATKQDAAEAVVAFDDILDNWGLTAADAQTIMDKLIVSHQKYGGEIQRNEDTLAKLAPALRAANFEIDDGIALLGLFGSKGLDADQATAAFAKALTKVKSPAELQHLIDDIAATVDPFQRAEKAAKLFGARAGAKLANALAGANLDSYKIDMNDAAGATERAADAMDSTFSAKVQLAIKGVTAKITEFGAAFGPALTGLASLASLGAALGLDKVVSKAFGALATSAPVQKAAAAAGFAAGQVYSGAFSLGLTVGLPALAATFLQSAHEEINKQVTGSPGGLLQLPPPEQAKPFWELWGQSAGQSIADGTSEGLKSGLARTLQTATDAAKPAATEQAHAFGLYFGTSTVQGMKDGFSAQVGTLITSLQEGGGADLKTVSAAIAKILPDAVFANREEVRHQAVLSMVDYAAGLRDKRAQVQAAIEQLNTDIDNTLSKTAEIAQLKAQLAGSNISTGLKSKDPVVKAQAQGTAQIIVDRLEELGVSAGTLGGKAGRNYASALADTKPIVQGGASTAASGQDKAFLYYKQNAEKWGHKTGAAYAAGLESTYGLVHSAATFMASGALVSKASSPPPDPENPLHHIDKWGYNTAKAWVDGFRKAASGARDAALGVVGAAAGGLAMQPAFTLGSAVSLPSNRMPGLLGITGARAAGGNTYIQENHVQLQGLQRARDPFEYASAMERFQRTGVLEWPEPEK
jgi:phage-related minor tail protein